MSQTVSSSPTHRTPSRKSSGASHAPTGDAAASAAASSSENPVAAAPAAVAPVASPSVDRLPHAHHLKHSFSQPELFYQGFSPHQRHHEEALQQLLTDASEEQQQRHSHSHSHHHPPPHRHQHAASMQDTSLRSDEVGGGNSDNSYADQSDLDIDTSRTYDPLSTSYDSCDLSACYDQQHEHAHSHLGPSTYQFNPDGSGQIISSPTMAQHIETHQAWIEERRIEQQKEEAEKRKQQEENDTLNDTQCTEGDTNTETNESEELLRRSSEAPRARSKSGASPSDVDDDTESEDSDDLPQLSAFELVALCLPAAAVMIGWSVGEALLLPYLLELGVSPIIANFAFLINPLFGLFLQPFFGRLSDQCTLSMGRRRPFLLLFCLGSVTGLTTVVWSTELAKLFSGDRMGEGSTLQVVLIFIGFAVMDLSHDLLLMPARALLNDRLPDEQTDQGNAYFASISSIGTCIGLALTILPLENYFPWSILGEQVRATFTTATLVILACNLATIKISSGLDKPYSPDDLDQIEGAGEEITSPVETTHLLLGSARSYGSREDTSSSLQHTEPHSKPIGDIESQPIEKREVIRITSMRSIDTDAKKKSRFLCFAENPLNGIIDAFNILPRPLKFIWFLQLIWWYCVLHVNLWWTSWVVVELYDATDPTDPAASNHHNNDDDGADPARCVRLATIGLLVQAVVSFPSSASLPFFNRFFGITNWYHYSAITFGLSVCAIGFVSAYYQTLIIMSILGLAIPPIFSSSYILVEVYAAEADMDEDESEDESEEEEDETTPSHAGSKTSSARLISRTMPETNTTEGQPRNTASSSPPHSRRATNDSPPSAGLSRRMRSGTLTQQQQQQQQNAGLTTSSRVSAVASPTISDDDDEDETDSEFTTATLEDKRGTITALFNITMILSQLVVGLSSGFLINWIGNITIVFYVSGALLVITNSIVLFFRLSKPDFDEEPEEEEQEEEVIEAKIEETARQQHIKRIEKLERQPPHPRVSHPPSSPPLADYNRKYEAIPHIPVPVPRDGQFVRPIGDSPMPPLPPTLQLHPSRLKRSLSAPDIHLATRALRKSRAKSMKPVAVRVALFQPHRMTLGMRRDLLRGGRPRLKNVRELDSESGESVASGQLAHAARQRMRDAHNQRIERERIERLRERVRLFGMKVAMRAAQIKATKHHEAGKRSGHQRHKSRNNAGKRKSGAPTSGTGAASSDASTGAAATSATTDNTSSFPPPPLSRVSSEYEAKSSLDASLQSTPSNFFSDNRTSGRVHWSLLSDQPQTCDLLSDSSLIPLPAPGSQQEAELIERLAGQSVEDEQKHLAELERSGIVDTSEMPALVHLPMVLPGDDSTQCGLDSGSCIQPLLVVPKLDSVTRSPLPLQVIENAILDEILLPEQMQQYSTTPSQQ